MKPLSYYTDEEEKSDIAKQAWIRIDIDKESENEEPMYGFTSATNEDKQLILVKH